MAASAISFSGPHFPKISPHPPSRRRPQGNLCLESGDGLSMCWKASYRWIWQRSTAPRPSRALCLRVYESQVLNGPSAIENHPNGATACRDLHAPPLRPRPLATEVPRPASDVRCDRRTTMPPSRVHARQRDQSPISRPETRPKGQSGHFCDAKGTSQMLCFSASRLFWMSFASVP